MQSCEYKEGSLHRPQESESVLFFAGIRRTDEVTMDDFPGIESTTH